MDKGEEENVTQRRDAGYDGLEYAEICSYRKMYLVRKD